MIFSLKKAGLVKYPDECYDQIIITKQIHNRINNFITISNMLANSIRKSNFLAIEITTSPQNQVRLMSEEIVNIRMHFKGQNYTNKQFSFKWYAFLNNKAAVVCNVKIQELDSRNIWKLDNKTVIRYQSKRKIFVLLQILYYLYQITIKLPILYK